MVVLLASSSAAAQAPQQGDGDPAGSPAAAPVPSNWFFAIGVGAGGLTGGDSQAFSTGVSWTLQAGRRVHDQLHVMLDGEYTTYARYEMDPTVSQQQGALMVGVRWAPFEDGRVGGFRLDGRAVHVKAGVGVAHLVRIPYASMNPLEARQGDWGGAVSAGLGWTPVRATSYRIGFEATDSIGIYADDVRHSFGVNLLASLDLF